MFTMMEQFLSQFLSAVHNAMAHLNDFVSGGATDSLAQDPSTPPAGEVIGSVSDGNGLMINVYGEQHDGSVTMTVKVMEGVADLRGFFMDVGDSTAGVSAEDVAAQDLKIGDECVTSVGARDNNMNGTGEKFDVGVEIGTAGTGKDDIGQASFTLDGVTLEQLDGLTFGVRATSVGEDRSDGVKLVGEFDIPEPQLPAEPPPPSVEGNFPQLPNDITSIVLLYNTTSGDVTGDGFYAAKVADVSWVVEDDLDTWLVDATNYLQANDPNVPQGTELLGVAITHSDGTPDGTGTDYYSMDGNPGVDTAPTTYLTPDTSVEYDAIMV
jgi:hypothetical protein